MTELACGQVVWVSLRPVIGSEQAGHRPALVISGDDYLASVPSVVIVVPITTRDRNLPNHVALDGPTGLSEVSFAMTEQPRTVDRRRITGRAGRVSDQTLSHVRSWLRDFLQIGG